MKTKEPDLSWMTPENRQAVARLPAILKKLEEDVDALKQFNDEMEKEKVFFDLHRQERLMALIAADHALLNQTVVDAGLGRPPNYKKERT